MVTAPYDVAPPVHDITASSLLQEKPIPRPSPPHPTIPTPSVCWAPTRVTIHPQDNMQPASHAIQWWRKFRLEAALSTPNLNLHLFVKAISVAGALF